MSQLWKLLPVIFLTGCCYLVPCHYGTEVVGFVKDTKGDPIPNVYVSLYGFTTTSDTNGCFYIKKADALPLEISIQVEGFKNVRSDSKWGKYEIQIELVPEDSKSKSIINWGVEKREIKSCT